MTKLILTTLMSALVACHQVDNPKERFMNWAPKGKIIDNVICKSNQSLGYCLYLPSNYNISRTWPVIYCFDPKGDGKLPISLLKDIAEKLGYIVIGSNNSKNGINPDYLGLIVNTLLEDTKEKLAIDPKRLYTAGFSGGSRIACSIALTYGIINGVIACSAGFVTQQGQSLFNVIGIAGNKDMNYLEVKKLDEMLDNWPVEHQFLIFDGKHHWPPKQFLNQAITMLELFAMKSKLTDRDDKLIHGFITDNSVRINKLMQYNNIDSLVKAYKWLKNTVQALKGLTNDDSLTKQFDALSHRVDLKAYLEKEKKIETQEADRQDELQKAYTIKPLDWWKNEVMQLQKVSKNTTDALESLSATRLLAYISLMSYSYVNATISRYDWNTATQYLTIYGLADPDNPDYHYFMACLQTNNGENEKAFSSLKKAVSFGFKDLNKLHNDPLIQSLRERKDFDEVLKQAEK